MVRFQPTERAGMNSGCFVMTFVCRDVGPKIKRDADFSPFGRDKSVSFILSPGGFPVRELGFIPGMSLDGVARLRTDEACGT